MTNTIDRTDFIAHDTELGRLYGLNAQAANRYTSAQYSLSWDEEHGRDTAAAEDAVRGALVVLNATIAAIRTHEESYTGWSRFFLVTNTNGHIHSSLNCSTCFSTTTYAFLPELSGLTEADAVADQGEILCSICFPSAPVEWTNGVSKATLAERAARQTAKDERQAKKLAKALYADDADRAYRTHSRFSDRISTLAAAKSFLTDGAQWLWNHPSYLPEDRDAVAALLAERTGSTVEAELEAARKRAAKRR